MGKNEKNEAFGRKMNDEPNENNCLELRKARNQEKNNIKDETLKVMVNDEIKDAH